MCEWTGYPDEWEEATGGTVLLERYGMTEIGMALSNPLRGERRPGTVGHPLPGVEVKCVPLQDEEDDEDGEDGDAGVEKEGRAAAATTTTAAAAAAEGGFEDAEEGPGELLVRGPAVFKQYWGRPEATAESFLQMGDGGGWFRTAGSGCKWSSV